jgi:hypothetical protein
MALPDLLGHLSYVFICSGVVLLGHKNRLGWILRAIGAVGWIIVGFQVGMSSIWAWSIVFLIMDMSNYFKWKPGS